MGCFQAPTFAKAKDLIDVAAVVEPHQGTSYNPPVEAHSELVVKAAEIEARKVQELERMAVTKKIMDAAKFDSDHVHDITLPAGMLLDKPVEDEEADEVKDDTKEAEPAVKKVPKMKTKAQKAKAAKLLAEVRLSWSVPVHRGRSFVRRNARLPLP